MQAEAQKLPMRIKRLATLKFNTFTGGEHMKEQIKQKYMHMKMLEQQIEKMQEQMQTFDTQLQEISSMKSAVEEIKTVKSGAEILVPLATGIFVKASIKQPDHVLVNVGAQTAVPRQADEALTMLNDQLVEIEKLKHNFSQQLEQMTQKGSAIEHEMRGLLEQHLAQGGTLDFDDDDTTGKKENEEA